MSGKLIGALILIALVVVIFLANGGGHVDLNFGVFEVSPPRAVAFFSFSAVGVVIGLLLK